MPLSIIYWLLPHADFPLIPTNAKTDKSVHQIHGASQCPRLKSWVSRLSLTVMVKRLSPTQAYDSIPFSTVIKITRAFSRFLLNQ